LIKLFYAQHYDLLITVVPKAGLLGMLAGAFTGISRRLHIFQGEVWVDRRGINRYVLKTCDRITAYLATRVLAVSPSEKEFLVNQKVISKSKVDVLGRGSIGGVDLERFSQKQNLNAGKAIREDLKIPNDAIVLIFIGRIVKDKGILDLINAFCEVAKVDDRLWLLLVGPDEENISDKIEKRLGSLNSRMRKVSYTEKPEIYLASADFLCLPSYREGFGVVILEAASMSLPSIGSNIYGISDAIAHGVTGMLFQCGHTDCLKECILSLLQDKKLRTVLGANARTNVEKYFNQKEVVNKYIQYIKNC
jgi:glycosyltransferase involved in cell wall biosynthesis